MGTRSQVSLVKTAVRRKSWTSPPPAVHEAFLVQGHIMYSDRLCCGVSSCVRTNFISVMQSFRAHTAPSRHVGSARNTRRALHVSLTALDSSRTSDPASDAVRQQQMSLRQLCSADALRLRTLSLLCCSLVVLESCLPPSIAAAVLQDKQRQEPAILGRLKNIVSGKQAGQGITITALSHAY